MREAWYWIIVLCISGHANMMLGIAKKEEPVYLWWGFACFFGAVVAVSVISP